MSKGLDLLLKMVTSGLFCATSVESSAFNPMAFYSQLGLKNDARKYIDRALTDNYLYVPALINAGIISAQSDKFVESEEYFLKALSVEEQNVSALFNVALLYEVQRSFDNAHIYYSKLKSLGDRRGVEGLKRIRTQIK